MVIEKVVQLNSRGNCDIIDITDSVTRAVSESVVKSGIATVFVTGSTAGITTVEYETGLIKDLHDLFDRTIPEDLNYAHDARWGDGNGHSHIRASLLGPSLVIPFTDKILGLGTWQQIVVIDFDNRPRTRKVLIQIMGE